MEELSVKVDVEEEEEEMYTPFFFIRTSKFDLRLNVLIQKPI